MGDFEAFCEATFLPRCSACHAPHPQARTPKLDTNRCPDCGAPVALGRTTVSGSAAVALGDPQLGLGLGLQAVGRWLRNLANKV